jgi:hypothetical protein
MVISPEWEVYKENVLQKEVQAAGSQGKDTHTHTEQG